MPEKTIAQLEKELQDKKWAEHEKRRIEAMNFKDKFEKETQTSIYTSDDYCGLSM
ncbi:hypothetical protein M0R04_08085 [Candidatus Dojkabacteria bacterium]|jgi:hypothetical protein|nr:hypothetical protein [Candidatus Dojkabacteria bacterium]